MKKLPTDATEEYKKGFIHGMENMYEMVKMVFNEHRDLTTEELEKYIKENL